MPDKPAVEIRTSPIRLLPAQSDELVEALDAAGFDAAVGPADEYREAVTLVIVGLWLAEHIGDGLLDQLLDAAAGWARSLRHRKVPTRIQILYGPDGEVAREVEIPATEDED
jgi:hypothetical protein